MAKGVRFIGIILIGLYLGIYFKKAKQANEPVVDWHTETFTELKFQSPFKFESDPEMPEVPAEVQVVIKEFRQIKAVNSGEIKLSVVKTVYDDQVQVSLEGAAQGSINAMARELGDQTPIPNFEPIKGKSYDGYIGIYNTKLDHKNMVIRGAYIVRGQALYMMIAMFAEGQFTEEETYKIFDSIELTAK